MLARFTSRRRINEALAEVSPLAFADAVEAHVTSLDNDELRDLVRRSIKRMDSSERMQFAMFLGHDSASSGVAEIFSRPIMRAEDAQRLVESCTDFLPNRFAAFLRENPRAVPALGDDAINDILATLPLSQSSGFAFLGGMQPQRVAQALLVLAAAMLIGLVPLAAQYARQSGMIAETANPPLPAVVHPARHAAKKHNVSVPPRNVIHRAVSKPVAVRHPPRPQRVVALAPARPAPHARAIAPKRRAHRVLHVATRHERSRRVAVAPKPSMDPFEARARLVVNSYLGAVIAGNTTRALAHLGLPPGSDPKAISESAIVTRDAKAQIVAVKPGDDGTTHVQVDILGRRGEYFEVFSVTPDGTAVRIKDRFYIPVNRTAEEISARLLAQKPH